MGKKVHLNIETGIYILKSEITLEIVSDLKNEYKRNYPEKVIRWEDGNKVFKYITKHVTTMFDRPHEIVVPRGSFDFIYNYFQQRGFDVVINNLLTKHKLPYDINRQFELYDYQLPAVEELLLYKNGILEAPCGSGKTVMGVDIIDRLRLTTLILTHTTVIMNQWIEHLYNDLCIDEVGIIGGGKRNVCPITVGMVQTLQKFSDTNFSKLRRLFAFLMCDEAHHVPAYTFLKIVANFAPEYLYGLTATPERKDEKEFLLYDFMGPIRYKLSDEVLVSSGRITNVEVKWLETSCAIFNDEWHIMVSALIYIQKRNQMIVSEMIKAIEDGHSILMLSERVAHCDLIAGILNDRGIKNVCLAGDSRIPQELLAGFSKDYNIIVASMAIAKEGLDIPAISCIVLASPSNNEHVLKQMIGRGRRQKDKETLVIDIDDKKAPMFSSMASNRSKWYEQWNFRQDVKNKENDGFSMFEGAKYRPGARKK